MPDWTRTVAPWQELVEPDQRLRREAEDVDIELQTFLRQRFGWDGGPPRTLAELGRERKINQVAIFRLEQRAMRGALARAKA
jgi:DNA-directed RNA polymerase sigma subunit (sigma70/sigma32)